MRRLPPLNAVRAFEAAARHLSFARAPDELCGTPSAIGQSVSALERWLGARLFVRDRSQPLLTLTEAGRLDLAALALIHSRSAPEDWAEWEMACSLPPIS
jgi:LysR family glycine cleavage system transcriptional activator